MSNISIKDTLSTDINNLPGEIWEDVPGYEDRYQISQYSRVKSIIFKTSVIIKKSLSSGKYEVTLSNKRRHRKHFDCGRLTATVFNRPPKENEVLKRKDRNNFNDLASNLEWISRKKSIQTAYAAGKYPEGHGTGRRNGMAKLSAQQVLDIRKRKEAGISKAQLAKDFKVSVSLISQTVNNKIWKHLNNEWLKQ